MARGAVSPEFVPSFASTVFRELRGGLYRYLLRRLRSRADAEDLAQEVYLRLLRVPDKELIRTPEAYVYRVAHNVVYEFQLRERQSPVEFDSERVLDLTEQLTDAADIPEAILQRQSQRHELSRIMQELPSMQRAVLLLAIRHDLPHAEIGRRLGISLHTVRKYLYRGLLHCRQRLSSSSREQKDTSP